MNTWVIQAEFYTDSCLFSAPQIGVSEFELRYWHDGLQRFILIDTGYATLSDAYYASQRWLARYGAWLNV